MRKFIAGLFLFPVCFLLAGCLSEPEAFTCIDGSPLRLADDQWHCDSAAPVTPIPVTDRNLYVDRVAGADSNPGTAQRPWRTIVKAAATASAGDTVFIRAGTYDDGPIVIANSGTAGRPIVFKPDGFSVVTVKNHGMQAVGKSHIVIAHLRFEDINGATGNAIRIEGRQSQEQPAATDILIKGNTIINTWSSGIAVWGVRYRRDPGDYNNISNVVIESNTLELNTNGGYNEIVTVANGASQVDVRYNTIRFGDFNEDGTPDGIGDEGVDFKEGVRDSRIYGNTFYGLSDKAIYIDGGRGENEAGAAVNDPLVSNIDIFNNRIRDSWGGIVVTTEGQGDVSEVHIYNNVVKRIAKDGILVWAHPSGEAAGGSVNNVWVFGNTVTDSGRNTPTGKKYWGGIRSSHPGASVFIENNIAFGNIGFDINGYLPNSTVPAANVRIRPTNLCREQHCDYNNAPLLTIDATPAAESPALNNASAPMLPEWRNQLPLFSDRDICAVPRGQGDTGWDLGAVEVLYSNGAAAPDLLQYCVRP